MKQIILTIFTITLSSVINAQDFSWASDYSGDESYVTAMTIDDAGYSYAAVVCAGTVDLDPGPANYPIVTGEEGKTVLQKLDSDGNLIWVKEFNELGDGNGVVGDGLNVKGITVDAAGNILLTGSTSGKIDYDPSGDEYYADDLEFVYADIFILKLTVDGVFLWAQTFLGDCNDTGQDIDVDHNGDIYVTGTFCLTVDFNDGEELDELTAYGVEGADVFVLKLTEAGAFIWVKSIESEFYDEVTDLEIDKDNNVYIGGAFTNAADFDPSEDEYIVDAVGMKQAYLLKLTVDGEFDWVINIAGDLYYEITGVEIDSWGNVYAVGDFGGEDVDFDPSADELLLSSDGFDDIFVTKYTNSGDLIWAKQLGGTGYNRTPFLEISAINTLYITGRFDADIDVDPSGDSYVLEHGGGDNFDLFLTTLSEDGDFIRAIAFNGNRDEECTDLVRGTDGSVYLAGYTTSELDLNLSADEFILYGDTYIPAGYVLKLQDGNVGISSNDPRVNIAVFPNPSQGHVNLQLDRAYDDLQVLIMDQSGRVIQHNKQLSTALIELDLDVPNGIYFVQIMSDEIDTVLKVSITN